jgi:hypothetical protein
MRHLNKKLNHFSLHGMKKDKKEMMLKLILRKQHQKMIKMLTKRLKKNMKKLKKNMKKLTLI